MASSCRSICADRWRLQPSSQACGLYVSDLPLFDNSREMLLMAEQRAAEAALKDTFERLSAQLEVGMPGAVC